MSDIKDHMENGEEDRMVGGHNIRMNKLGRMEEREER